VHVLRPGERIEEHSVRDELSQRSGPLIRDCVLFVFGNALPGEREEHQLVREETECFGNRTSVQFVVVGRTCVLHYGQDRFTRFGKICATS